MSGPGPRPVSAERGGRAGETPGELPIRLPNGVTVRLPVRRSGRARRIMLRLLERRGVVELVLPGRASVRAGRRFAEAKAGWIHERLAALPPPVRFSAGAVIPVMGQKLPLKLGAGARGNAARIDGALYVPGPPEGFTARVERWLRAEARREIELRAVEKATAIGMGVRRISVRDPATSWGSCSARGTLSFSWRLVLAPAFVLDYVVAHEVAHLVHPHHGPSFWALVDTLTEERLAARRWLRAGGAALRRYG